MNIPLDQIVQWLLVYKYLILFPIMVVEGPIITVIAGFLASQGTMNFIIVYLLALAGDLTGDIIYYSIGRLGKKRFLRQGKLLGVNQERMIKLEKHFENNPGKTLIFGKLTHAVGWPILTVAGVASMPLEKFIWFNFLGTLPKVLFFEVIGYYFGKNYELIDRYINNISAVLLVIVAMGIVIYFVYKKRKNKTEI